MTDQPHTVHINVNDTLIQQAVAAAVATRADDIRNHHAQLIDTEADARLRRGHDPEHVSGWHEAAEWLRRQRVIP